MVVMNKFEEGDRVRIKTDAIFEVCYVNSEDGRTDVVPIDDPHDMSIEFLRPEYLELVERVFNLGDVIRIRASGEILVVVKVDSDEISLYSATDRTVYDTNRSDLSQSRYYEVLRG